MRIIAFIAIAAGISSFSSSSAAQSISCRPLFKGGDVISISINSKKLFGKDLSCINTMAAEGETCASNGGTSLLYPTGLAKIAKTFDNINDIYGHYGSMISFYMSSNEINFNGGRFNGTNAWSMNWSFNVDRASGKGKLRADRDVGVKSGNYICKKITQKF